MAEVLCWGGPEHGKVWAFPKRPTGTHTFAVMRRPSYKPDKLEPLSLMIQTVAYQCERVVDGWQYWDVLVYLENHAALMKNLQGHIRAIYWMAHPYG